MLKNLLMLKIVFGTKTEKRNKLQKLCKKFDYSLNRFGGVFVLNNTPSAGSQPEDFT